MLAGAAALILAAVALTTLARQPQIASYPPPPLYHWSQAAASGSATAQEAFARGVTLTLCDGTLARTNTVTWVENGPNYGMALIYADCASGRMRRVFAIFTLGKTPDDHQWIPQAGLTANISASATLSPVMLVPPWLPLPPGTYAGWPIKPQGLNPPASVRDWYTHTLAFVVGYVADRAVYPAGAITIRVAGHNGWETERGGIVAIEVPLVNGTTFFFAGTGSPRPIEQLAALCYEHIAALLDLLPGTQND
jgi:hypothetical protein